MKYKSVKKKIKIKEKITYILLSPIRWICVPTEKYYYKIKNIREKKNEKKRYSPKEIKDVVQYLIDYWSDGEEVFFIVMTDKFLSFENNNIKTPETMLSHMFEGMYGEHKKIKKKAEHIYRYQQEEYFKAFRELCSSPISEEEKRQYFPKYELDKIKDIDVYKGGYNMNMNMNTVLNRIDKLDNKYDKKIDISSNKLDDVNNNYNNLNREVGEIKTRVNDIYNRISFWKIYIMAPLITSIITAIIMKFIN